MICEFNIKNKNLKQIQLMLHLTKEFNLEKHIKRIQ